jgi:hypothetical protein
MAIANITNNILTDSGVATSSLLTTSAAASTYQTILTNPVTGTGTTNYLPKFTGASTIGNSVIYQGGSNIGIGETNPASYPLQVKGADGQGIQYEDTNAVRTLLGSYSSKAIIGTLTNHAVGFWSNNSEKMILSTSGNLGLGVTPSAWGSPFVNIQVGNGAGFTGRTDAMTAYMSSNYYYNSGDKYIGTGNASLYIQTTGQHIWYNAPSGTAGNAITFTQAMTLTAAGRLLINKTNEETYQLDVNGTGRFSYLTTANTNIFDNTSGRAMDCVSDGVLFAKISGAHNIIFGDGAVRYYSLYTPSGAATMSIRNFSTSLDMLTFTSTGAATFSSTLGIGGVADNVKASTYSPTLTGVLNYTSGSGNICTFSRIANIVTVFFDINVNATAVLSKTECFISLPIPSTFTTFVGVGSGVGDVSSGYIPVLAAYGGGTNIVISFYSPATSGTYVYRGSFSYEVT